MNVNSNLRHGVVESPTPNEKPHDLERTRKSEPGLDGPLCHAPLGFKMRYRVEQGLIAVRAPEVSRLAHDKLALKAPGRTQGIVGMGDGLDQS